ncbi:hypothetical protein BGZ65_007292 [Modicella reniformis]|uniref:Swiss Army Knife 2H phosphoesterase domain-containing protein n=1 Tax=Modicella reniformis TaxID=1440133 RepID=A0A9P6J782_9FUNG|nr:hypothetical protein BGZ65_007292 [Modicella reniformis]
MKVAAALIATLTLVASTVMAGPNPVVINKRVFQTDKVPFIPHSTGLFANWVGLNIDFRYVRHVFNEVNTTHALGNGTLISRGESHITVILPTEYDQILHPAGVTIEELNHLATTDKNSMNRLQRADFGLECLGRVQMVTKADGVFQQSLQLILKNYQDLILFREDVFKLFVSKGGNPALFDPENFKPHITLGYRHRDLHVEDGVYKGKNACIRQVVAR